MYAHPSSAPRPCCRLSYARLPASDAVARRAGRYIAHQGEQIRRYREMEAASVPSVRYVHEGTQFRGTTCGI